MYTFISFAFYFYFFLSSERYCKLYRDGRWAYSMRNSYSLHRVWGKRKKETMSDKLSIRIGCIDLRWQFFCSCCN